MKIPKQKLIRSINLRTNQMTSRTIYKYPYSLLIEYESLQILHVDFHHVYKFNMCTHCGEYSIDLRFIFSFRWIYWNLSFALSLSNRYRFKWTDMQSHLMKIHIIYDLFCRSFCLFSVDLSLNWFQSMRIWHA